MLCKPQTNFTLWHFLGHGTASLVWVIIIRPDYPFSHPFDHPRQLGLDDDPRRNHKTPQNAVASTAKLSSGLGSVEKQLS